VVTAIVGDVDAERLMPLLEKYFGRIPARPEPPPLRTVEPPQIAERTVRLEDPAQPVYVEGYHKPAASHADQAVYDAIDDILSGGRTSRLYRSLVRDQKIAVEVGSFSGFPGRKYPNVWAVYAFPARGVDNDQVQASIRAEVERLKSEDVTAEELRRFKTRAKATLLRSLADNLGLASNLATYQTLFGDWRELFTYIGRLEQVSAADIRRVASAALVPTNRTVAMIVTAPPSAAPAAPGSGQ
jgi:predicted Zn-dependent peptidase